MSRERRSTTPGVRGRRQRARRLPPDERRARLIESAVRVFARRGIGEARHAEIAKDAGVSLATTFVYFPTRQELVDAVLSEVARFYSDMAREIHAREDLPAGEVLLAHANAFARSTETHPDYARVWLDWSTSIRDAVWPKYLAFQDSVEEWISRTIARGHRDRSVHDGLDPHLGARLMISAAHMVVQMQFSGRPQRQIQAFVETVMRAIVAAMSGKPSPSLVRRRRSGSSRPAQAGET